MPIGTCDPASRGDQFNVGQETFGTDGLITYRYGWDGVSTMDTGCVGPLQDVTCVNNNPQTWYAHFQGRKGTWKSVTMAPGFNQTYNRNQLRQQGFNDSSDLEGLYLTTDPTPPAFLTTK